MRIDTAAHTDCVIPPYYDSMIAKVIAHGRDRNEAIARMRRALEMSVIEGIKTTIPLHLKILNDPDFQAGRLSTSFMDRYQVAKSDAEQAASRSRLSLPGLYAVLDAEVASAHGWTLVDLAAAVLDGGATLLQVRAKTLSSADLLELSRQVVALAAPFGAAVVVNDRADIAVLAGAAGVHVGQDDLSPAEARAIVGPDALVGVSTHSPDQIAEAARAPVSYIAVGPVFGTPTKATGYDAVGLDLVRSGRRHRRIDVVAIGGVTLDRVPQVIAAGATSVAVITDLLTGGDPAARTRAFVDAAAAARAAL